MLLRILFISLLIIASSNSCLGLDVHFRPQNRVSTKFITLADIADIPTNSDLAKALGSQIIGPSPSPGETSSFDSGQIAIKLGNKLSLPSSVAWKGASKVQVENKGIEIGTKRTLSYIDDFLTLHKAELPKAKIQFVPRSLPLPFILPDGEVSVEVLPSDPSILGSSRFALIFKVNGKVKKNMSVSGKIEALAHVAIAVTPIKKGSILRPKQIAMQLLDIAQFRSPCLDPREILGKRAKRTIKAGSIIEHYKVEFPPLVKKGQLVKIMLKYRDMFISASGIARMNGKKNEIIRVQNSSSKKLIYCRVIAPGIVEVTL